MRKTCLALGWAAAGLLVATGGALASCKGNFRLEFGHTNDLQWATPRNTTCGIQMQFDYVALYGLAVRQSPRNGTIQMNNHYTFTYTPKKGFFGQDSFIVDAEGAPVNYLLGTTGQRSKAGMAFTMTVQ
jgi:Bacterial Ig domain